VFARDEWRCLNKGKQNKAKWKKIINEKTNRIKGLYKPHEQEEEEEEEEEDVYIIHDKLVINCESFEIIFGTNFIFF